MLQRVLCLKIKQGTCCERSRIDAISCSDLKGIQLGIKILPV